MTMHWPQLWKQHNMKTGRSSRRRARCGPILERLEDRTVPTSLAALTYNNVTATPLVAKAFLTDLNQDVLFRPPDSGELSTRSSELSSGKLTPGGAFANLVASSEFKNLVSPVLNLYQTYLGRPADFGGLSAWVQLERQGTTLPQVATAIAQSAEFQAQHGNALALSDDGFVTFLYQTLYQRAPEDAGRAAWNAQLASHTVERGDLLVSFVESPEFAQKHADMANRNVVRAAYAGLWNQNPDGQFDSYVSALSTGSIPDAARLATQFINSPQYQTSGMTRNYVLSLYDGILNREPDWSGYREWRVTLLSRAMTDSQAYAAFLKSSEFQTVNQPLELMYEVYLSRSADEAGLRSWLQAQRSG
jgi:hypothetical protein